MPNAPESITVDAPPPADRPVVREGADAHARLQRLANELTVTHDRRYLIEYLRLRRALR
ncbi:MAG TPA: hypothetical protein VGN72_22500 [Tepidisphaeraceae bacterium]|jgi:hypothetical protein|nr:hypothetical protein [Tepidisphaeraceae bacterium]